MPSEPSLHPFSTTAPTRLDLNAIDACFALDQRVFAGFWSANQWHQELQSKSNLCFGYWCVEKPNQLIGLICGCVVADELQISMVAVDPNKQQQGLGGSLLQALLACAKSMGCQEASLEVSAKNKAAIALYEQAGFTTCGIRKSYYRNGDNALIKAKRFCEVLT